MSHMNLNGKVAVVTGASRGVGGGVARELARHEALVFVTGRSTSDDQRLDERITAITCDHRVDGQVDTAFERILKASGAIDILVNNIWGGYERMVENGEFTWPKPFWQQPLWRWDAMFSAGVRAHYQASQLAAPSMIARRRGLIVNISSLGGAEAHRQRRLRRVESRDRQDDGRHGHRAEAAWCRRCVALSGTRQDGKDHGVRGGRDLPNSESPEFIGRAVAALAADPDVLRHTGKVLVAASVAIEYGFTDIDGTTPRPLTLADV